MGALDRPPLPEAYHDYVSRCIDEKGIEVPHGLVVHFDNTMTVYALAVPPEQAYEVMLAAWAKGAKEMIFALDRFTKPGQGTDLPDVMAGHYFLGPYRRPIVRPFIIEYQHTPRIVKAINWSNGWWNLGLRRELASVADRLWTGHRA